MCAKLCFSISSRCDDIVAEVKGGNYIPPATGGWRGGPAAAGLGDTDSYETMDKNPVAKVEAQTKRIFKYVS